MNFFDEDPMSLPCDAQYYFNILVICVAINPQCSDEILGEGIEELTYIDKITDARPCAVFLYVDDELDDDIEYEMECYPHCVVEVSGQLGVSWWPMLEFDTDDPWRIE